MPVGAGRDQPLAALWRVDGEGLATYLAAGGRSLRGFAERIGVVRVDWDPADGRDPFFNVNDPAALEEAERRLASAVRTAGR